jgi:hypothetical protein
LEVVVFGVGDMRVSDHEGLCSVLSKCHAANHTNTTVWDPLFVMETANTLPNLPQWASSLLDSASLLWTCIQSLDHELQCQLYSNLHVSIGKDGEVIQDCMVRTVIEILDCIDLHRIPEVGTDTPQTIDVTIHVCDIGDADNELGTILHLRKVLLLIT